MKEKNFVRVCSKCGNDIFHTTKKNRNRADKSKKVCNCCAQKLV